MPDIILPELLRRARRVVEIWEHEPRGTRDRHTTLNAAMADLRYWLGHYDQETEHDAQSKD